MRALPREDSAPEDRSRSLESRARAGPCSPRRHEEETLRLCREHRLRATDRPVSKTQTHTIDGLAGRARRRNRAGVRQRRRAGPRDVPPTDPAPSSALDCIARGAQPGLVHAFVTALPYDA